MKLGIGLRRKNRRGRLFALNFQIGYRGVERHDEDDAATEELEASPPSVEEPKLKEIPPETEEYSKSYGKITSYKQWLERERDEQRRITNSRLRHRGRGVKSLILVLLITLVATSLGVARIPELTEQEKARIDELYQRGIITDGNEDRFLERFTSKMVMKHPDRIDRALAYMGMSDFTFAVHRHRDTLAAIASCILVLSFLLLIFVEGEWAVWLGAFVLVMALCFIPPKYPAYTFAILAGGPATLFLRWIIQKASYDVEQPNS